MQHNRVFLGLSLDGPWHITRRRKCEHSLEYLRVSLEEESVDFEEYALDLNERAAHATVRLGSWMAEVGDRHLRYHENHISIWEEEPWMSEVVAFCIVAHLGNGMMYV